VAPRLTTYLPLGLVVVSLLFLALLPMFIQGRIAASLDELSELTEPARTAVTDMQVAFAQETAGTHGFLLTRDERHATSHHTARSARRRAHAWLVDRAARMTPEFRAALVEMGRDLGPADELVDALYSGKVTQDQYGALTPVQYERFQAVTAAMARLQLEIGRDAATRRERILAIHRFDALLSLAGVLLAFGAITSVARLSMKNRSLAERERSARAATEMARVEVERRRDEVARISASRQGLIRGFSHDVKNSLNVADGYLFMLERGIMGPLASDQRNAVEHSRHSVKTAMQLIQDSLDLARAETGDIDLHVVTTDLCQVAVRAVEDYRAQADSKGARDDDRPASRIPRSAVRSRQGRTGPWQLAEQRDQIHGGGKRLRTSGQAPG
jgi:signal transduction histidine kinase